MYKKCEHYNSVISESKLQKELDTHYRAETGLVVSIMRDMICEGVVKTRHELGVANEELWDLNDWPEGEGFGSSDRHSYIDRVKESIAFERKFLQAETELVSINKLEESPKNDDVRTYMKMNDKIAEGMAS